MIPLPINLHTGKTTGNTFFPQLSPSAAGGKTPAFPLL